MGMKACAVASHAAPVGRFQYPKVGSMGMKDWVRPPVVQEPGVFQYPKVGSMGMKASGQSH